MGTLAGSRDPRVEPVKGQAPVELGGVFALGQGSCRGSGRRRSSRTHRRDDDASGPSARARVARPKPNLLWFENERKMCEPLICFMAELPCNCYFTLNFEFLGEIELQIMIKIDKIVLCQLT